MKITMVAGEASGDLYGASLAQALFCLQPKVEIFGLGGPRMRRAGVHLLCDTSGWGAIGVTNALRVAPKALMGYVALKRHLQQERPEVMVPIDFGAFNARAGRFARRIGIPVFYFIAPGSWRRSGPIRPSLLAAADVFLAALPWHAERLRAAGARAEFYGHPLLDIAQPSAPAETLRQEWGLPENGSVVALFPGSRRHEVEHLLPVFLDAGAQMQREKPAVRFLLGLAEVVPWGQVARILRAKGWRGSEDPSRAFGPRSLLVVVGRTYDCLAVASAALCCSGTVTLEAALFGVPQVIAYRGSLGMWLQYQWVKRHIRYVGLPNLLLDEAICPELLAEAATPDRIAAACLVLLSGGKETAAQKEGSQKLRKLLGHPGAIQRAAERILALGERECGRRSGSASW